MKMAYRWRSAAVTLFTILFLLIWRTNAKSSKRIILYQRPVADGRGYMRFHANDSIIGRPVPCTYEEKICFRYNTLFSRKLGRCFPRFDEQLRERSEMLMNGSGHLNVKCNFHDNCPGYRMAYDGRCYRKKIVRDVICGCDAEPTPHFLGGVECRCSPATPVHVEQPEEEGRCHIPDLRFPVNIYKEKALQPSYDSQANTSPFKLSEKLFKCFSQGKVWLAEADGCFPLNERGPCAEDHVVVLTKMNHTGGSAVCRHIRGDCIEGFQPLAGDGQCHDERELKVASLQFTELKKNMFGEYFAVRNVPTTGCDSSPECSTIELDGIQTSGCCLFDYNCGLLRYANFDYF